MTLRRALMVGLLTALVGATAGGSAVARPTTLSAKQPSACVVGVVQVGTGSKLMLLDARTLKPVRPGWSRAVPQRPPAALSPAGSRIAIGLGARVLVLDATTGRTLDSDATTGSDLGLYWLGGEGTRESRVPLIITTFTSSKGDELQVVGDDQSTVSNVPVLAVLRVGLVLPPDATPTLLVVWPNTDYYSRPPIELPKLPVGPPVKVVADVSRDRLFAVSSAGMVATITRASSAKPIVAYHRVPLNGKPFDAAWAGSGRIALWGENGLGTIDTRTWKTHAIAPDVSSALTTPYGITAWTKTPDGLSVYKADGTRRLQRLQGKQITTATSVGPYLYADTTVKTRYSIDLRTGKTTGPLPTSARIVTPSYVVIP